MGQPINFIDLSRGSHLIVFALIAHIEHIFGHCVTFDYQYYITRLLLYYFSPSVVKKYAHASFIPTQGGWRVRRSNLGSLILKNQEISFVLFSLTPIPFHSIQPLRI